MVKGKIEWISGPAVKASGMAASKMYEVVEVGEEKLVGEVIKLSARNFTKRERTCSKSQGVHSVAKHFRLLPP